MDELSDIEKAIQIWCIYHYNTEMYDREVCQNQSFQKHGFVMPSTTNEIRLININAKRQLSQVYSSLYREGIQKKDSNTARNYVSRLSFEGLKSEIERYEKENK